MMHTVSIDTPDPRFAKLLLEQFGGASGELAAALRYFTQAWNDPEPRRRSMLLYIAAEGRAKIVYERLSASEDV